MAVYGCVVSAILLCELFLGYSKEMVLKIKLHCKQDH